jgi:hypothetical protein
MSGYHEGHLVSGTSAVHSLTSPHTHPLPLQLQHQHQHQPAASVPPYLSPPNPAAAHAPHALAQNGRSQGPASVYTASAHDSLTTALQVPITPHGIVNNTPTQHQHQHQQGHQSPPQPQHIRPQTGQYSSPGNHASSASPQSQQAPTPAASTSSASAKKNTRIPRACDLCSTRKVKVSCLSGPGFFSLRRKFPMAATSTYPARYSAKVEYLLAPHAEISVSRAHTTVSRSDGALQIELPRLRSRPRNARNSMSTV